MQSLNFKDVSIWNIIITVIIIAAVSLMLFLNNNISDRSDRHDSLLSMQAASIEKLEAEIRELEKENLELKQNLSFYNEKNFKKLLVTISEHDRKIDLLNKTIRELY